MILDKNIHPERDLYFLGGQLIDYLEKYDTNEIDFFDLYLAVNKNQSLTMNLYTLVLDWLFILGIIKKGKNGMLEKCF
jgi:hypothetical protein